MELLDSTGVRIHLGDTVWFTSNGKEMSGVVEKMVMKLTRHWHTKVEKALTTVNVRCKSQPRWTQLHIFHKPSNLTVQVKD